MKVTGPFLVLLLAAGIFSCGKQQQHRHIVILPDVSGSIERQALEQAFKAIDEMIGHLQRGDRIAVIPILGDAEAEASGRSIRFEVPKERRAYDGDLRDFRRKLAASLAEMRASAVAHPGSKTDILGSIGLAEQEFQAVPDKTGCLLVVLSDFIQEDNDLDFRKDGRLATSTAAKEFAAKLLKVRPADLQGTRVYLGLLRSGEYGALSKKRRDSIQDFWLEYFKLSHGQTEIAIDGIGLVEDYLQGN